MDSRQFFDQDNLSSDDLYSFNDDDYDSTKIGYLGIGEFGLNMLTYHLGDHIVMEPCVGLIGVSNHNNSSYLSFSSNGTTSTNVSGAISKFVNELDILFVYADIKEAYVQPIVCGIKEHAKNVNCLCISMFLGLNEELEKSSSKYGDLIFIYAQNSDLMTGMCYSKKDFTNAEDAFSYTTACLEQYIYWDEKYYVQRTKKRLLSIVKKNHICVINLHRVYVTDFSNPSLQRNLLPLIDRLSKIKTADVSGLLVCCSCSPKLSFDKTNFMKEYISDYLSDNILFHYENTTYEDWDKEYFELLTISAVKSIHCN